MPTFTVHTNMSRTSIPDGFLKAASSFIAGQLGKPESYVTVRVHPDTLMSHGGTGVPCASIDVCCIGKLGVEENKNHSAAIADFITEHLGIAKDRFYIRFADMSGSDIGYNGTTFA